MVQCVHVHMHMHTHVYNVHVHRGTANTYIHCTCRHCTRTCIYTCGHCTHMYICIYMYTGTQTHQHVHIHVCAQSHTLTFSCCILFRRNLSNFCLESPSQVPPTLHTNAKKNHGSMSLPAVLTFSGARASPCTRRWCV